MFNSFRLKILVVFLACLPVGCRNKASTNNASALRVAMVLPGTITDQSWNQAGHEGLMLAKDELGVEVAFSEKIGQPDQAETMSDYARRGFGVVIGHGGEFQDAAEQAAKRYPKTTFVVNNGTRAHDNLSTVSFKYKQIGYLVGYLGGKVSKTGKGSYIGAQKIKFSTELASGFEQGFKDARSDGEVFVAWTNDWDDLAKGKEAALNHISQGADVVFPTMDNATKGSLQAAKERKVSAIGIYYDAIEDWPDTVIQSAILDIRAAMVDALKDIKGGKAGGKVFEYGVETPDAMRLGTFHATVPEDVRVEIEKILSELKAGTLSLD